MRNFHFINFSRSKSLDDIHKNSNLKHLINCLNNFFYPTKFSETLKKFAINFCPQKIHRLENERTNMFPFYRGSAAASCIRKILHDHRIIKKKKENKSKDNKSEGKKKELRENVKREGCPFDFIFLFFHFFKK